jgi:hypothetical protein
MAEIRLFRDSNFLGGSIVLNGDASNLKDFGFTDVLSSIVVVSGTFTLFQDQDFGGFSVTVSPRGGPNSDGQYPSQKEFGNRGDTISSVKLNSQAG